MSTVAGVDLIPLPYESSVSLLLRLAYWNRLRPSDFASLGITVKRSHQTPLHLDAQGRRRLRELTHWRVDPREAWLFHLLQHTHMLLPGLRFCARCLASGYHSYFFQLACIARCPLHQEVLWNDCPCCGFALQSDFSRRGIFAAPYYCPSCDRPLGLHVATADSFLMLRRRADTMADVLLPPWLWIKRVAAMRRVIPALFQADFGRPLRPALASCQGSVLCMVRPADCIYPTTAMTVLTWNLRRGPRWDQGSEVKRKRLAMVYRATLRSLRRWIEASGTPDRAQEPLMTSSATATTKAGGDSAASDMARAARAYELLRYAVERRRDGTTVHADVAGAEPAWDFRIVDRSLQDMPRLPLRAVFLGMFAESYLRLEGREDDYSAATEGVRTDAELVLCGGLVDGIRWGFVCFPRIAGLPTRPFKCVSDSVNEALLVVARKSMPYLHAGGTDEDDPR
ncbi:hypothetical protein EM868_20835 [Cupriavidus gilardii]|uniref:hypothetical protein n=1 Tax=Cupriavidus gilardii TaxID=82541 RepID=UPI001EE51A9A|nr:hypothetical protein [Cupriavidus gilardii]MCG5262772.1 hypothetical protein [Cupriavidus gilardii]MDF9432210.1 hypothetical protein [Cupriavidus gilardii]